MRAKPKFDCDQTRTKALTALDKPKLPKRQQRKPASAAGPQAQR
jgi:ABC-type polar amino acid transport system ATPase subunit